MSYDMLLCLLRTHTSFNTTLCYKPIYTIITYIISLKCAPKKCLHTYRFNSPLLPHGNRVTSEVLIFRCWSCNHYILVSVIARVVYPWSLEQSCLHVLGLKQRLHESTGVIRCCVLCKCICSLRHVLNETSVIREFCARII